MSTVDKQTANAADPAASTSTPHVELHDIRLTDTDGYATLHLGRTEESMVTLTESRIEQIEVAIRKLATASDLRGVTITGPGPGMFCAGADVNLIRDITVAQDGEAAAIRGRSAFAMLQDLKVPVVAAIEGPCLGGGFELALFCDVRVASSAKATQIGLPEVKLGIVPGFGGTQNLTRLIGLPKALELILNGKLMRGKQALRARIIDRLVPANKLLAAAREEIDKLADKQQKSKARKLRGMAWWLSHTPLRTIAVAGPIMPLRDPPPTCTFPRPPHPA